MVVQPQGADSSACPTRSVKSFLVAGVQVVTERGLDELLRDRVLEEAEALIGFIDDAPADMTEHHDHYLYGHPKA